MPDRPADSDAVEVEGNFSSGVDKHGTDVNLVLEQLPNATPEAASQFGALPNDCYTISPALVQPTSRGQVRLASANWRDAPIIDGNYLGTDQPRFWRRRSRAIGGAARELGSQKAYDGIREAELIPGAESYQEAGRDTHRFRAHSLGELWSSGRYGKDR